MSDVEVTPSEIDRVSLYNRVHDAKRSLEKQVKEARLALARAKFEHFIEYVMRDSSTNLPIKVSGIHKSWFEHIEKYENSTYDIGVLSMWGFGKSTVIAIARALFLLGRNRNLRIGIICNSDGNAVKRVSAISEYIRQSKEYNELFPHIKPGDAKSWNDHRLVVERDVIAPEASIEANGIDSTGVGSRYDVLIFDDPVDQADSDSEAVRKRRIDRFNNVWSSRIEPHGKRYYIATRWHKYDLTHEVLQKETWKFIVQAVTDDFEKIIEPPIEYRHYVSVERRDKPRYIEHWKEKWSIEQLKRRAADLGVRAFNRGLRQRPYSEEDTLFKEETILGPTGAVKWDIDVFDAVPDEWPKYTGVDLAGDKRPGTAIVTIARNPKTGRKVLCEILRGRWGWSARTAGKIWDTYQRWSTRVVVVENNAAQETMITMIRELFKQDIPIKGYTTGKAKADPYEGLPGLAVEFENGIWTFPMKHKAKERKFLASSEEAELVLIRELIEYPHSATSDCLMALWFANIAAKQGQGLMAPGIYTGSGQSRMFANEKYRFSGGYGRGERGKFGGTSGAMGQN